MGGGRLVLKCCGTWKVDLKNRGEPGGWISGRWTPKIGGRLATKTGGS